MLQSVKLKRKEDIYNLMNLQEEMKIVRNLENCIVLKKTPDKITDICLLEKAVASIEAASEATGREYVFKEIQQLSIGSSITLYPREYNIQSKVNWVLGTYDKEYLLQRIKELRGEAYQ